MKVDRKAVQRKMNKMKLVFPQSVYICIENRKSNIFGHIAVTLYRRKIGQIILHIFTFVLWPHMVSIACNELHVWLAYYCLRQIHR